VRRFCLSVELMRRLRFVLLSLSSLSHLSQVPDLPEPGPGGGAGGWCALHTQVIAAVGIVVIIHCRCMLINCWVVLSGCVGVAGQLPPILRLLSPFSEGSKRRD
jgi:hypothetical protein